MRTMSIISSFGWNLVRWSPMDTNGTKPWLRSSAETFGVLERVTTIEPTDNSCSKARVTKQIKRKPGTSPLLFGEFLGAFATPTLGYQSDQLSHWSLVLSPALSLTRPSVTPN